MIEDPNLRFHRLVRKDDRPCCRVCGCFEEEQLTYCPGKKLSAAAKAAIVIGQIADFESASVRFGMRRSR